MARLLIYAIYHYFRDIVIFFFFSSFINDFYGFEKTERNVKIQNILLIIHHTFTLNVNFNIKAKRSITKVNQNLLKFLKRV